MDVFFLSPFFCSLLAWTVGLTKSRIVCSFSSSGRHQRKHGICYFRQTKVWFRGDITQLSVQVIPVGKLPAPRHFFSTLLTFFFLQLNLYSFFHFGFRSISLSLSLSLKNITVYFIRRIFFSNFSSFSVFSELFYLMSYSCLSALRAYYITCALNIHHKMRAMKMIHFW